MNSYSTCIDACEACVLACHAWSTEPAAAWDGGGLTAVRECTQACELAIFSMTRNGCVAEAACSVCARLCEDCGRQCARHEDAASRRCAQACARAAQECRRVLERVRGSAHEALAA